MGGGFFPEIPMRKLGIQFDEALVGSSEIWSPSTDNTYKCHTVAVYDGEKLQAILESQGVDEEASYDAVEDLFVPCFVLGLDAPIVLWRDLHNHL